MGFLNLFAEPGRLVAWYLFGALAAAWVWRDLRQVNTALMKAMKWAWPIIVFFFSPLGLLLYFATARAPGVAQAADEGEKKRLLDAYERLMPRRVNGAVIHCVAGDGLGIMTAMVIARVLGLGFWQEFWFEYAVGFAFGWFIFQYQSMAMMTDSKPRALAMAFRAEFFSMLTVMGGMGAVMAFVTPTVVGMQPKPWTAAFWGFGMLGLLVGYVFTFPMNWMIVKIGWKHGMGNARDAHPVQRRAAKLALFATMCALGAGAACVPAWLALVRERQDLQVARAAIATFATRNGVAHDGTSIERGLGASLDFARAALQRGARAQATASMDNAMRAAQVVRAAALPPGPQVQRALATARRHLQDGDPQAAAAALLAAPAQGPSQGQRSSAAPREYRNAKLVNAAGAVVGELRRVEGSQALLAVGGGHRLWGFWLVGHPHFAWVPADALVFGPAHALGKSYVMLPTIVDVRTALAALPGRRLVPPGS